MDSHMDSYVFSRLSREVYSVIFSQYLERVNFRTQNKIMFPIRMFLFFLGVFMILASFYFISGDVYGRLFLIEPTAIFIVGVIAFLMSFYLKKVVYFGRIINERNSKKLTDKVLSGVEDILPFTAKYSIENHFVTYSVEKESEKRMVWKKKLKGIARQGELVTILFPKWAPMFPYMTIFHSDKEAVRKALEEQGIECRPVIKDATV